MSNGGKYTNRHVIPTYWFSFIVLLFRFPSMESNIEMRNGTINSKAEFNNLFNTSNRAIYSTQRLNRSLPRKFKTTSIPVRHSYPNYSHGNLIRAQSMQSMLTHSRSHITDAQYVQPAHKTRIYLFDPILINTILCRQRSFLSFRFTRNPSSRSGLSELQ